MSELTRNVCQRQCPAHFFKFCEQKLAVVLYICPREQILLRIFFSVQMRHLIRCLDILSLCTVSTGPDLKVFAFEGFHLTGFLMIFLWAYGVHPIPLPK